MCPAFLLCGDGLGVVVLLLVAGVVVVTVVVLPTEGPTSVDIIAT